MIDVFALRPDSGDLFNDALVRHGWLFRVVHKPVKLLCSTGDAIQGPAMLGCDARLRSAICDLRSAVC